MIKDEVYKIVKEKYETLLPDVDLAIVKKAFNACYEPEVDASVIIKRMYSFMYPVKEPSLY